VKAFAESYHIPVVTSLRAKGAISEDSPMAMGVFGLGGSLWANHVVMGAPAGPAGLSDEDMPGCEVLLVLGATLNENNTNGWNPAFRPSKAIVRVDLDPHRIQGREYGETSVVGDVSTFMAWLSDVRAMYHDALDASKAVRQRWLDIIQRGPYHDGETGRHSSSVPIHPARVIVELRKAAPRDSVLVVDSGAHTFFAGHHWASYAPNEFFLLSNTGPMGYGVAMAIGAALARPDRPHIAVVGDGSLLMHGMELHTAVRFKVPIVVVVINNAALGNVYLRARHVDPTAARLSTIEPQPDWAALCIALGGQGTVVKHPDELGPAFARALKVQGGPFLVDVRCDRDVDVPNVHYVQE
jgi:acetolactate synthase-1/2/3 large subunit